MSSNDLFIYLSETENFLIKINYKKNQDAVRNEIRDNNIRKYLVILIKAKIIKYVILES